ncbi:MAG: thiolase family protein [Candidatus Krumholzibacteria bacterium]
MKKIKIKSAHLTRIGVLSADYVSITMDAVRPALSGVDIERVAHVYLSAYAPAELCGITDPFREATRAIQSEFPALRATYHGLFKTGGEALYTALADLSGGGNPTGDILVVGSEKMTHLTPSEVAGTLSGRENTHDGAYGATLPALGGLVTHAYLSSRGVPEQALHAVAVKNHRNGALNPKAHFQKAVTPAEVASSPLVRDPLRRLHCSPISDGAAALLLGEDGGEVAFAGWGKGTDTPLLQERRDVASFAATARASEAARAMAGIALDDINVVEIHDAFVSFELINLEALGFYEPGTAWRPLDAGDLETSGRRAVNPSGGMKARGHPIGATALTAGVEMLEQLTGRAGARQHRGARAGMIQSVGGVSNESYVFIVDQT